MTDLHEPPLTEVPSINDPRGDGDSPARPPWLGVELRHLAALAAVAREGSFRGAADSLGYVQSAVSQQLSRLEGMVGARLVDRRRGASHVAVTEAGALLLEHFTAIVARLDAAHADLEAMRAGRAGTLAVGVDESTAARLMPPILRDLAARLPEIEVRLEESRSADDLARGVETGALDLAFGDLPLPPGPFELNELIEDPYVLLVPAHSPLADAGSVSAAQELLAELPLIGSGPDGPRASVEAALREREIEPRYVFRSESNAAVQAFVAAGIGVAIVPSLAVEPADARTTTLPLDGLIPTRTVALYWHRERRRIPARDAFVRIAAEAAGAVRAPITPEAVAA